MVWIEPASSLPCHQDSVNEAGIVYPVTRTVWMRLAWFIPSQDSVNETGMVYPVTRTVWTKLAWFISSPGQCEWSWHGLSHHQDNVNEAGMVYPITRTVWIQPLSSLSGHQDSVNPPSLDFIISPGCSPGQCESTQLKSLSYHQVGVMVSLASTESTLLPGQCKLSQHRV